MNTSNSKFQIILIAAFIVFALVGVILFSANTATNTGPSQGIVVWGSMDESVFSRAVAESGLSLQYAVDYQFISAQNLERQLTEALAEDRGPDLILYPHEYSLQLRDRIVLIPFSSFPERSFTDTFIDGSSLFLTQNGAVALPVAVDPLVMYWNKTLYTNGGFVRPPLFWDEVPRYIEEINVVSGVDIRTTAFALGTYGNISHAKDILSTFFLQAGVPIVEPSSTTYIPSLQRLQTKSESAVRFYTEFSNPSKSVYSWNSAMPNAQKAFLAGTLATYFGFASEAPFLRDANPNLSFDVAVIPQVREADKTGYATFWGISVVDKTTNVDAAFAFLGAITSRDASAAFSEAGSFASARRDLLIEPVSQNIFMPIFNQSAVIARGWNDPNPQETEEIFRQIIQSVSAGGVRISEAILSANELLESLIDSL